MKKTLLFFFLFASYFTQAQEFGLSFSYFIPKNGYFSTPISPFSIRGLGVNLNRFVSIETGASLYRMSGLTVKDMPFSTKNTIIGPNFTLLVPVELIISLRGQRTEFDIKGGAFGFLPFANKLDYGNFDRGIRTYENWRIANSEASFSSSLGYGLMAGVEFTIHVTNQVSISLESNYLAGDASFPIKGTYTGVDNNDQLQTKSFNFSKTKMDLTGLEFSVGVTLSTGKSKRKQSRRR